MLVSVEFVPKFKDGQVVRFEAKYRSRQGQIYNDAMAVVLYVVNNQIEYHNREQSYRKLSEGTGIPLTTIKRMIKWHIVHGVENCVLHYVAFKAGIIVHYDGTPGRILFARYATDDEQWVLNDSRYGGPLY